MTGLRLRAPPRAPSPRQAVRAGLLALLVLGLLAGSAVGAPLAQSPLPTAPGGATTQGTGPGPWTTVPASTAGSTDPNAVTSPDVEEGERPAGHRLTPAQAGDIARADPEVAAVARETRGSYDSVFLKGQTRWQLSVYAPGKPLKEIGQVLVDDRTARVTESWTGPYVAWTMARGYDGAFGGQVTNPWVWCGLLAAFLLPLVRLRPRLRLPPVELLLLAAFSVPLAFFNTAHLTPAVLISAALLVLLLGRALRVGLGRPRAPRALDVALPLRWLAVAAVGLLAFRGVLAVTGGNVIDVGYASIVGADRLAHLDQVYGAFPENIARGDTYGPLTYLFYVPFELVWPWRGGWDSLQAATAGAIALDALTALALYRLGARSTRVRRERRRRDERGPADRDPAAASAASPRAEDPASAVPGASVPVDGPTAAPVDGGTVAERTAAQALRGSDERRRGRQRGILYAYLWLACPWSAYAMSAAANDALVSLLLVVLLLVATSGGRAVSVALAAAAKLAPASLVPVVATHPMHEPPPGAAAERRRARLGPRHLVGFAIVAGSVTAAGLAVGLVGGGTPALLLERTLGYQAGRDAPFTPWGLYDWKGLTAALRVAAVVLAIGLALLPRRADRAGLAAAMLAVLLGFQLATEYWFYLYLTWLVPLVLVVALHGRPLEAAPRIPRPRIPRRRDTTPAPPPVRPPEHGPPQRAASGTAS